MDRLLSVMYQLTWAEGERAVGIAAVTIVIMGMPLVLLLCSPYAPNNGVVIIRGCHHLGWGACPHMNAMLVRAIECVARHSLVLRLCRPKVAKCRLVDVRLWCHWWQTGQMD